MALDLRAHLCGSETLEMYADVHRVGIRLLQDKGEFLRGLDTVASGDQLIGIAPVLRDALGGHRAKRLHLRGRVLLGRIADPHPANEDLRGATPCVVVRVGEFARVIVRLQRVIEDADAEAGGSPHRGQALCGHDNGYRVGLAGLQGAVARKLGGVVAAQGSHDLR